MCSSDLAYLAPDAVEFMYRNSRDLQYASKDRGRPDMAPPIVQAKGATPPSDSPGQRSERPGEPGPLLDD